MGGRCPLAPAPLLFGEGGLDSPVAGGPEWDLSQLESGCLPTEQTCAGSQHREPCGLGLRGCGADLCGHLGTGQGWEGPLW